MSCRSVSRGERSGTANTRSFLSFLPLDCCSTSRIPIGLHVVDRQDVEGVAVFRLRRWNEAPVVRIGKAGYQRLCEREQPQLQIEVKLAGAIARGLDNGIDGLIVGPNRNLKQVGHVSA